jgi:hypothetical protein
LKQRDLRQAEKKTGSRQISNLYRAKRAVGKLEIDTVENMTIRRAKGEPLQQKGRAETVLKAKGQQSSANQKRRERTTTETRPECYQQRKTRASLAAATGNGGAVGQKHRAHRSAHSGRREGLCVLARLDIRHHQIVLPVGRAALDHQLQVRAH